MMKDTTKFWQWFANNQDRYRNIHTLEIDSINALFDELIAELRHYSEGLYAEIGGKEAPYELIITPQGSKAYFSDAEYLVLQAPEIPGWELIALKPPHGATFDFEMGDMKLNAGSIFFAPLEDEEDEERIGVCIYHKDYQTEDTERQTALINGLYYCMDSVLGERAVTLDINFMEFETLPENTEDSKLLPIAELKNYIDWRKKERASYEVRQPDETVTMLEGKIGDQPVIVLINRNYKYYNYTSDFPFLLTFIIHYDALDNGLPAGEMQPIYDIEDRIVQAVTDHGHYLASETHDGSRKVYCYFDTEEHAAEVATSLQQEITDHRMDTVITYDKYWTAIDNYL